MKPLIVREPDPRPAAIAPPLERQWITQTRDRGGSVMIVALLAAALASSPAPTAAPAAVDAKDIPNYHLVRPGLATAGQPSDDALGKLKGMGFKTVINLRTPGEQKAGAEEEAVRAQGLRYVSIPVNSATFGPAEVSAVRAVLDDESAAPILLHCTTANRAAAVWGLTEIQRGRAVSEVEADVAKAGLSHAATVNGFHRVAEEIAASRKP
jgi:uncharacterized protein (TIGR01244 family)